MSQISTNQSNSANHKPYHTPELRKFGNIKNLTLASPTFNIDGIDGGGSAFPNVYAS
ncbi:MULTISPECIES: hypothetical protein [unclassified Nodularia (in: cyanobacteria)]|uniref:hypothetical protein n=1 Tax=unclassified Nodularia (in: cyanobacteria) TaxID=2656917 RepID=UPI0018805E58|nr:MULTISPECIES: hypothetical protein [unclassified Nodularia (in: cyanobacteria)]MBE9198376.1 hypothetical protein [Nodularia sp. LEGE 06071]MCC2691159.1 hypothetical protein [Nodularia sp. LEGE 04288]